MMAFGVTRGLPNGWGVDLSGRLGMQNLLIFGEPAGNNDEDWKAFMWDLAFGPFGRIADNTITGLSQLSTGSVLTSPTDFTKALVGMIPVKILSDSVKALRGVSRGQMDTPDAVLRVLGFTSGDQANLSREIGAGIRESQKKTSERRSVENKYLDARTPAEIAKATSLVKDFIASQPKGVRVTSLKTLEGWRKERVDQEQKYLN
jgi:hypothetical protein